MSPQLRSFLQWWLHDATSEHPSDDVKYYGLCTNVWRYSGCNDKLKKELKQLLIKSGLEWAFPFEGNQAYNNDKNNGSMHLRPARLAWVRKQLEE